MKELSNGGLGKQRVDDVLKGSFLLKKYTLPQLRTRINYQRDQKDPSDSGLSESETE